MQCMMKVRHSGMDQPCWGAFVCRFVDSLAFREFKRTGKPEFREFCHGPGLLKAVWRTVLGLTGFGQGAAAAQDTSLLMSIIIFALEWV